MVRARDERAVQEVVRRTHVELGPAAAPGAPRPSPWTPGAEFSRYEIGSRLAQGGMAEVWRAKVKGAAGFERRIVIKTMLTQLQHRPELVQMFVAEAAVAAQLSHPNIVHVFDFGQLEGRYFIAMEYVPGVTLRVRAQAGSGARPAPAGRDRAARAHRRVRGAAASPRARRRSRRTRARAPRLSPDNVILSTSGAAKLIDFGAARATTRTPPTSAFVGKYRYAAPERIRRDAEDRRADIYSAGIILYECLAGARPFEGTDADVIKAATSRAACDPRDRVPTLPAVVAEVVCKATAQDPVRRFATARELSAALGACLAELGAFSKERDVTAALAALLDTAREPPSTATPVPSMSATVRLEAVPELIEVAGGVPEEMGPPEPPSDAEIALCEVEILEASGPIAIGPGTATATGLARGAAAHEGDPGRRLSRPSGRRARPWPDGFGSGRPRLAHFSVAAAPEWPALVSPARGGAVRSGARAARRVPLRRGAGRVGEGAPPGPWEPGLSLERGAPARAARAPARGGRRPGLSAPVSRR